MGMFWGLNMQPNLNYKQLVLKSFHMSGACINKGTSGRLYLKIDGVRHILAHLDSEMHTQVMFNLNFEACEELIFRFVGDASVTLYGFLVDEPDPEYETEMEEDFKLLNESYKKGVNNLASDISDEASKDSVDSPPEAKKRKISNIVAEKENGEQQQQQEQQPKQVKKKKKPVKNTHIIHKPQPLYPQQLYPLALCPYYHPLIQQPPNQQTPNQQTPNQQPANQQPPNQ